MELFIIINNVRIKANADVNAKNLLIKEFVIKDLFRILVTVNVNVINHCDIGEYLDYENCKYRKRLIDKLVD